MSTNVESLGGCAPRWNFRARWFLFYLGPAAFFGTELLLIGGANIGDANKWWQILSVGWDSLNNRDFWVPLLWGFWMPWFNGPRGPVPGLKKIVFRDFNGNPFLPLAIPVMHALIWSACSRLPIPSITQPVVFAAAFLIYDILMIRYDLLQIYGGKFVGQVTPKRIVKSRLALWWLYLGTGLVLIHNFGSDSILGVLGGALGLIIPMQILLFRDRRIPIEVKADRIAVIGAGWAGTYAAKWLSQAGVKVRVYERSKDIGGLWKYDESTPGTVAESTFASSSSYYMHASDFPMDTVAFPKHKDIYRFINEYADKFNVREKVSFCTHIADVRKEGGHWKIKGRNKSGEFEEEFDGVVVASGFNEEPRDFDKRYAGFDGKVLHSSRYKHTDSIAGYKRIVVVGLGESAADVAHECAQIRDVTVYLSGSEQWFAGRFISGGFPADTLMAPGVRMLLGSFLDFEKRGRGIIQSLIGTIWGKGGSGVEIWNPPVPWLHGFVTKSRSAIDDVHEGKLTPKSRIVKCDGKMVEFTDGSTIEADLIIDCTGFAPTFPFLEGNIFFTDLYRLVFYRKDPTLSFVGTARPMLGSIPALAELQARWVAAVYSGRVRLPNQEEQEIDTYFSKRAHRKRFFTSEKRPNLVDHEFYAQAIASDIGASVPWFRMLFTRPRFFWMFLFAPWMAFKYNLRGKTCDEAVTNIRRYMPTSAVYYGLIAQNFIRMAKFMWAMQLSLIVLAISYMPPYVLLTIGGGWIAHNLTEWWRARSSQVPAFGDNSMKMRDRPDQTGDAVSARS